MSTKTVLLLVGAAVVLTAVPDSVLSIAVKTVMIIIAIIIGLVYLQLIFRAVIVLLTGIRNRWGWWRILILSRGPDTSTDTQYPVQLDLDTDTIEDYRR